MRRTLGLATSLLLLAACGADGPGGEEVVRTDPFRTTGAYDGETDLLTACGDAAEPIELEWSPTRVDLADLHAELTPKLRPGETIFLDLLGVAIQDGDDVSFEVIDVYRAGWWEEWWCEWQPSVTSPVVVVSGTEPDWQFHVGADSVVVLSRPDGTLEGSWTLLEGSLSSGWAAEGVIDGAPWTFEAFEEPCRNQMSGAYSHLVGSLTWQDQTWAGCGFMGDAEALQ